MMKILIVCVVLIASYTEAQALAQNLCYTQWFNLDNPVGLGDYETLEHLRQEYPNQICPKPLNIQAETLSGVPARSAKQVIQTYDTLTGFACGNSQQKKGQSCLDYKVRFGCPCPSPPTPVCYTQWFNLDNPVGMGDYETLQHLRQEYPNQICPKPLNIQAETLSGVPAQSAGQVFKSYDTVTSFACGNSQQKNGQSCLDYKVRFGCPCPWPPTPVYYTQWFDRDDPGGMGDYETLEHLRQEYPNRICPGPLTIQAETLSGVPAQSTGQVIQTCDTVTGFACVNSQQKNGQSCLDYKVRFACRSPWPLDPVCYTQWFDRDDPGGMGDYETLEHLRQEYPNRICPRPLTIQAVTLSGALAQSAGQVIQTYDTVTGFACVNSQQNKGRSCLDYKVRFGCPCSSSPHLFS